MPCRLNQLTLEAVAFATHIKNFICKQCLRHDTSSGRLVPWPDFGISDCLFKIFILHYGERDTVRIERCSITNERNVTNRQMV